MDRRAIGEALHGLLPHLGNPSYLARQPLATTLSPGERPPRGERVRRALLALIEELRPITAASNADADWRQYRHLVLRYLEGRSRDQVAAELGVSTRQASRDHERAIDGLAELLLARRRTGAAWDATQLADENAGDLLREATSVAQQDAEMADLADTLSAVVGTLAPSFRARGAQVRSVVPDTLPAVKASRTLLRQALLSALAHVAAAGHPEQILVTAHDTARGPMVRISAFGASVEPGAAPADTLDAARQLIELQTGALDACVEREGYSVTLTVPSIPLKKVLVVDDNPDVVMLVQRYLRGAPYRVVQARSSAEAVRLARELRPDAVTLDVMLPSQDGWDILSQLRALAETAQTPVIVCSVLPEREIALALGVADFLAKPISRAALLAALDRCLASQGAPPTHS